MPKYLIVSILSTLLALAAAAQDDDGPDEGLPGEVAAESTETGKVADATGAGEEEEEDGDEDDADAEEIDDSDLDKRTYEEDDDVFIPSEEIPADEPIPFPTNI